MEAWHYDCAGNQIVLAREQIKPQGEWDQLVVFCEPVDRVIIVSRILNRDGSEAKQCLNGMRALSDLACRVWNIRGMIDLVLGGKVIARGRVSERDFPEVFVNFPDYTPGREPTDPDKLVLGNEHEVYWTEDRRIEKPSDYKPLVNQEFVHRMVGHVLDVKVFEAGVGETGSCGSGAVAVGFSAYKRYGLPASEVRFPGGSLYVNVAERDEQVSLAGPTTLKEVRSY